MSSPSVNAENSPIALSTSADEPFVAPDQVQRDATQTDLARCSSLSPQDSSNAKAQPILPHSPSKGSPACSQGNRAKDLTEVPQQLVLYLAGDGDEDNRDRRSPSTTPSRAILDWLSATGPPASGPSQPCGRTGSLLSTSSPSKQKGVDAPSLPPSPSSSVLDAFVDKVLGPEFAKAEQPRHLKSTVHTVKAAVGRAARCDRCRSRNLKCVILSKTGSSCNNCRRAHVACTRDQLRVSGNQTPVPRPPSKKGSTTALNKTLHDHGDRRATRSSRHLENEIKSDSIDSDDVLPRGAKRKETAAASGSDPGKQELDSYTFDLLKDVMHALERVKGPLGDPSSLPALVPTLALLEEGFDAMPSLVSEPMLSTVCTMLQRIKVQCLRKAKLRDAVEIRSAVWYTQTLVDRTLSCIKSLIDTK